MLPPELHQALIDLPGVHVRVQEPMAAHTPLRVGGPVWLWAIVSDYTALYAVQRQAKRHKVRWRLNWPMERCIVRDAGFHGVIIRPGRDFEGAGRRQPGRVWLGAASPWAALTPVTRLTLSSWPGTPGGLFAAGDQDCLRGLGLTMRWMRGQKQHEHRIEPGDEIPALKPTEVLLDVELDEEQPTRRRLKPPPSPGHIFEASGRTDPGELILRAGVCGSRLRDWRMTPEEPGTIVNTGSGNCHDLLMLVRGISERVKRTRGTTLNTRIPVFGERS